MKWKTYFERYIQKEFPSFLKGAPWNYKDDLCIIGANDLWEETQNTCYLDAMRHAAPYLLNGEDEICNYTPGEYNIDKISFGKSLLLLYKHTAEERYKNAAIQLYDELQTYPRTHSGVYVHKAKYYPNQVWLDGLYMAQPFRAWCEVLLGSLRFDDIIQQFEVVREKLFVPETQLYIHAWDESGLVAWADKQTKRSPSYWLRAQGWHLMALVDVYEYAKAHTEKAQVLAKLLKEAVEGLMPYLDKQSGMFLQLTNRADLPHNYPETSGSAMVAYSLMKGARLKMIDAQYAVKGKALLEAIRLRYLREEAGELHLYGICASAGLGDGPEGQTRRDGSAAYYLSEAQMVDNQHGAAACMMAYAEGLRKTDG